MSDSPQQPAWDVFISYASEDRETVAGPLSTLLMKLGVKVWFDQAELKVGDSLRRKIDEGLSHCRFGVVVLSPNFLSKAYPNRELDGLAQRELDGNKVILPVWNGLDVEQVRQFSPPLADRVAAKWGNGIHIVAAQLLEVIRPDILERTAKETKVRPLSQIADALELQSLIAGAESSLLLHDELSSQQEVELIGSFLEEVGDWMDIWNDIGPKGQAEAQLHFSEQLKDVHLAGWSVWGGSEKHVYRVKSPSNENIPVQLQAVVLAVVRGHPTKVIRSGDGVIVFK